ncbi:Tat pathway signal sequence [Pyrenophora seminiperda CCB06]|uniref:Tat pathway signal sequence n=1 Tax=Pyrenophora seminiperda CCB06 TaxID=1302712 RepID=A0A3M7LZK5_9PLEO|nr:Tat pathway signal sequence [Pyrenophora seminiperda CCB06]
MSPPYSPSPSHNIHNVLFSINSTYAAPPNADTQADWEKLLPRGRGFVQFPGLMAKGETRAVAVFCELRCLYDLRTSYFRTAYALSKLQYQHSLPHHQHQHSPLPSRSDHPSIPPSSPFHPNPYLESLLADKKHAHGPEHITHCFEYLRQALMCASDTNLEDTVEREVDGERRGVEGDAWGTRRVCRDFEGVKEWAERWRVGTRDEGGIV